MGGLELPEVFTAAMARAAGYSSHQIEQNVRSCHWHSLRRGVFCTAQRWQLDAADPVLRHVLEAGGARLAVSRYTVVSGWSAALLHDLPCPAGIRPVTLTATEGARIRRPDLQLTVAPLPLGQVQDRLGLPTTTAARCAIDLARRDGSNDFAAVVCLIDAVLYLAKANKAELDRVLASMHRWPGSAHAARALAFSDPRAENPLESRSRLFIAELGLPAPETQVEICDDTGRFVARVDFLWPEYRTVGEADGYLKYRIPGELYREKRREDRLRELGFEVVRWGWADIRDRRPETAQRVRAALDRGRSRAGTIESGLAKAASQLAQSATP